MLVHYSLSTFALAVYSSKSGVYCMTRMFDVHLEFGMLSQAISWNGEVVIEIRQFR